MYSPFVFYLVLNLSYNCYAYHKCRCIPLFCLNSARLKNRLFCSEFCPVNISKPNVGTGDVYANKTWKPCDPTCSIQLDSRDASAWFALLIANLLPAINPPRQVDNTLKLLDYTILPSLRRAQLCHTAPTQVILRPFSAFNSASWHS